MTTRDDPVVEPTDRASLPPQVLFDALRASTAETASIRGRVDVLERSFQELEETLDKRMGRLETQMTSMNAHLDNIARESAKTNDILEKDLDRREAGEARALKRQDENRSLYIRGAKELWEMFRIPTGGLITAIVSWLVYYYFLVPGG